MGFKMDSRTAESFRLALERKLQETIPQEDAGAELRQLAREEKPVAVLKAWESEGLLESLHPLLAKRHPDYDAINRVTRVREDLVAAGFRPRLFAPVTAAILGRLKDRERSTVLGHMSLRAAEQRAVDHLEEDAQKVVKLLSGPKTASVRDAYAFLEKTPLDFLGYILAESSNGKAVGKIKSYLNKWKPLRQGLPGVAVELETLGLEHGPKFDKVLEDFFQLQLLGRGRKPEDHVKILRKLSGIKEPPKKVEEKKKPEKPKKKGDAGSAPDINAAGEAARPKGTAPEQRAAPGKEAARKSVAARAPVKTSAKSHKKKAHGKK
jgi:tRNA nucleotidyltransferase/poly(A) polymerase